MKIEGIVKAVLPVRSGATQKGEWASMDFVLETQERYPQTVVINIFGKNKIDAYALKSGDMVSVDFEFRAREYNGRWFNEIRAWAVNHLGQEAAQPVVQGAVFAAPPETPQVPEAADDSLPF